MQKLAISGWRAVCVHVQAIFLPSAEGCYSSDATISGEVGLVQPEVASMT